MANFNLNRLVQPECGGSNPLVSAAQQITMKPSATGTISRIQGQRQQAPVNFSQEFMKQQYKSLAELSSQALKSGSQFMAHSSQIMHQNPVHLSASQSAQGGKLAKDFLSEHGLVEGMERIQVAGGYSGTSQQMGAGSQAQSFMHSSMIANFSGMRMNGPLAETQGLNAGDQLETKYRNDMISQNSEQQHEQQQQQMDSGKVDDVEFWQTLSQKYIGPKTYDNIAAMRAGSSGGQKQGEQTDRLTGDQTVEDNLLEDQESVADIFSDLQDETTGQTLEPDMEYHFDERNPLKDQFEDPFSEGLKKLEEGDIPSAVLLFEAAVQLKPEDANAWRYLGTTQAQNENDQSAIKALRNCLKLNENDQQARLAISVSLANETMQYEACCHLVQWLMGHERYKSLGASLEDFKLSGVSPYGDFVKEEHYSYVRDKFVDAARMSPNNPDSEVQSSLGVLFNIRGEYEKAVDCFKAALSVRSNDSVLWNRLGATLANGNKSDEAVVAYRKALEISPGFLRSRYNLAISLIHLNTYDEAAKQLVQILNMQAAGKGSRNPQIRTRSITSYTIWNTLRTVATLMNKPDLYPMIDGRDLDGCNASLLRGSRETN